MVKSGKVYAVNQPYNDTQEYVIITKCNLPGSGVKNLINSFNAVENTNSVNKSTKVHKKSINTNCITEQVSTGTIYIINNH